MTTPAIAITQRLFVISYLLHCNAPQTVRVGLCLVAAVIVVPREHCNRNSIRQWSRSESYAIEKG
jgi:hypothetical protein